MTNLSVIVLRYFNPVGNHSLLAENPRKDYKNLFPIIMSIYGGKKRIFGIFGSAFRPKMVQQLEIISMLLIWLKVMSNL